MLNKFSEFFGSKAFIKSVLLIAFPIIVQQLITSSVMLVDNVMVGRLGEDSLSAVATVNQIVFILYLAAFGLTGGAGIFLSQFFGAKDTESLKKSFSYKLVTSIILYCFGTIVILSFDEILIALFLDKGTLSYNLALDYLKFVWPSFILSGLSFVFSSTLREIFLPKYAMISGIMAILLNTILNALLIFGFLGFPELGVIGAAIATSIAKFVELSLSFFYYHKFARKYLPSVKELFVFDKELVSRITKKALPLLVNETFWSLSRTVIFYAYATRGIDAITGINMTTTISNMAFTFIMGTSSAIQIMVGAKLGEGDLDSAKDIATKLLRLGVLSGVFTALALILASDLLLSFYVVEEYTLWIAKSSLLIYAIVLPFVSINNNGYFILRSGGAMKETMIVDMGVSTIVTVPLAFILAEFTSYNVVVLYLIISTVDIIKIFLTLWYFKKGIWLKNLAIE